MDPICLSSKNETLTYGDFLARVAKSAQELPDEPVIAVVQKEPIRFLIQLFAIWKAKKIAVVIPLSLPESKRKLLIEKVSMNPVFPTGTDLVLFTSGSSGEPKGVCL